MLRIRYFGVVAFVLLNLSNSNAQLAKPNWNDFAFRMAKDQWTADGKGFHAFGSAYLHSVLAKKKSKENDFTWRRANDKWTTDDKGFHAFGSAYLYSVLAKKMPKGYAALTTIVLGAAWEVKDAYVRYEVVPILGGDGFSYKDLTFDVGGVGLGLLRDLLFKDRNSKSDKSQRARVKTGGN
jgi:uncharacterized protein YfiM (DUF2279 family)